MFGDLHNHTTSSDGEYTPVELVDAAQSKGIRVLGISDHDTVNGLRAAHDHALKTRAVEHFVPGVEVSLRFKRDFFVGTLHYLVYMPPAFLDNAAFIDEFNAVLSQARGEELTRARVRALNAYIGPDSANEDGKKSAAFPEISHHPSIFLETPFSEDEIARVLPPGNTNATRRHFALALQARGLTKDEVNECVGNSSPAYLPSGLPMEALAPFLQKYPSLVKVLAHPAAGSYPGKSHYREVLPPVETVERLLPEIAGTVGIDGFEVYYPGHTEELRNRVLGWMKEGSFLATGGSDCHDRVDRPLGVAGIDETLTHTFLSRLK